MRRWLPELVALPLLPWLLAQGKRTRRITPHLPEAAGARQGTCLPDHSDVESRAARIDLLAIGESPVAGVGVDEQEQAITAQFARQLATTLGRSVCWTACGKNGATVAEAMREQLLQLRQLPQSVAPPNHLRIVLIAFGVNDSTAFRSSRRYHRDLGALIAMVRTQMAPDLLVIAGVPPLHLFPALPQPLRHVLGMKAAALSRVARQLAAGMPDAIYVPVQSGTRDRRLMASDGYHPSAAGVRVWAQQLTQATAAALARI